MLSFIVPAHNEECELPASLRAIRNAADPAGQPYEIIVASDDSDDRTAEIAQEFDARVVEVRLRQIAAVRNAGAAIATGEIFFFVDADTHIAPVHVTAALEALKAGSAGGSARIALDAQVPFWARVFLRIFALFYFGANLGVGAFIFMAGENFERAGRFDEQFFAGEEMYLTQELKKLGPFTLLAHPITTSARKVRLHSGMHVFRQWTGMMLGGKAALRSRDRLGLWYDGKREQRAN